MKKILILGGGFGGVFLAKKLYRASRKNFDIELISDNNYFVFQPLLPEVASGAINAEDAVSPLRKLLKGVKFRNAEIKDINLKNRKVLVLQGFRKRSHWIHFDHLVIALGQESNLKIIPVRMNNDLQAGLREELKNTGTGNIFMVFGEPDIKVAKTEKNKIKIKINGLDVYDPTTGSIRNNPVEQIACWFIDTDYDGESFYVKHAYFVGNEKEFESLKKTLKLELDLEEWSKLNSTESIPFEIPKSKKIALKVINNFGDEILKVYNDIEKEIK